MGKLSRNRWVELSLRADELAKCVHCGLCHAVCPPYLVDQHEGKTARGKIDLLQGLLAGTLKPSAQISQWLDDCLTCYACQTVCPAGVRTERLWTAARQDLAPYNPHTFRKRVGLRWTIGKPGLFRILLKLSAAVMGVNPHFHSRFRLFSGGLPVSRLAPLQSRLQDVYEPVSGAALGTVGLVIGCSGDIAVPWAVEGAIQLLIKSGWRVVVPKWQGCCGAPAVNNGDWALARRLVRRLARLFERYDLDYITSPDATCSAAMRHDWLEIFHSQKSVPEPVKRAVVKVRGLWELVEVGVRSGRVSFKDSRTQVALHHSCHSFHLFPTHRWEAILRRVPGIEIVPMDSDHLCCGFGGSYALFYPEHSKAIARMKIDRAREAGAELLLVGSPGCLLRLNGVDEESPRVEYVGYYLSQLAQAN